MTITSMKNETKLRDEHIVIHSANEVDDKSWEWGSLGHGVEYIGAHHAENTLQLLSATSRTFEMDTHPVDIGEDATVKRGIVT